MISQCRFARTQLAAWSRRGVGHALPDTLQLHCDTCASCRATLGEITETRRWTRTLPVHRVRDERLGEIRFALMAATRHVPPPVGSPAPHVTRRFAWLAAVLLALSVVLWAWVRSDGGEARPIATITLDDDAKGWLAGSNHDQVYVLERGQAEFDVDELDVGKRFRVFAGGDVIEVRGTRFSVQVEDGGIAGVAVTEGRVLVRRAQGEPLALRDGDHWRRPAVPPASIHAHSVFDTHAVAEAVHTPLPPLQPKRRPLVRFTPVSKTTSPTPSSAPNAAKDAVFRRAWQLYHDGESAQAAVLFDELAREPALDEARRVDVLYWSARAHALAGDTNTADARTRAVMESRPEGWHAAESALMLGESLIRKGRYEQARAALLRAASSPRSHVRSRALTLLRSIAPMGKSDAPDREPSHR